LRKKHDACKESLTLEDVLLSGSCSAHGDLKNINDRIDKLRTDMFNGFADLRTLILQQASSSSKESNVSEEVHEVNNAAQVHHENAGRRVRSRA
jgi:hypothetical protein